MRRLARALPLRQQDARVGAVGAEPGAQEGRSLVDAGCGFAGPGGCIVELDERVAEGGLDAVVFEVAVEERDRNLEAPEDGSEAHFEGVLGDVGFSIALLELVDGVRGVIDCCSGRKLSVLRCRTHAEHECLILKSGIAKRAGDGQAR